MASRGGLPEGVAQSTIDHFSAIPLARGTLEDPNWEVFPSSRGLSDDGRGHTLTGKTWNTDGTIKDLLSFQRKGGSSNFDLPQLGNIRGEVRRFYTFGSDMNAHPDLLHGGVIATILDSTLGHAIGLRMFTVQLNVSYKKPVKTPGTVMVRAWVTKVEDGGRKIWTAGVIEGEGGVVHAKAEGLMMKGKAKL